MESQANPVAGIFGILLLTQLVLVIAALVGGLYLLYSMGRIAAGMERTAGALEEWLRQQKAAGAASPAKPPAWEPPAMPPVAPVPPTPPLPVAPLPNAPTYGGTPSSGPILPPGDSSA